jgi:hypothetical protein
MNDNPNYLTDVLRLAEGIQPGSINHVTVLHDAWCAQLNGTGPCNCEPIVRRGKPSQQGDACQL